MDKSMSHRLCHLRSVHRPVRGASQRGIALVITLLLLSMVTVLSLGMVLALSSQTLIGGFYRNYRGSFYAADSGINVAVQYMENQLVNGMPGTFSTPPISGINDASLAANIQQAVQNAYQNVPVNTGNAAGSWKESFSIQSVQLSAPSSPVQTGSDCYGNPTSYTYSYPYTITAVGSASGAEQATIQEQGTINLGIQGQAQSHCVNFSYFGGFVDQYPACLGPLVPGTMTGPMFTNNAWEFMPSISPWTAPYIFTDPVGQVWANAYYWDTNWNCHASPTTSYGTGANLVAPTFQQGFQLNVPNQVPLPADAISQEWAAIDGIGCGEGMNICGEPICPSSSGPCSPAPPTLTAALLNSYLENINGVAYPHTGASSGVFVTDPGTTAAASTHGSSSVTPPCVQGGGFYIEGSANVELQPSGSTAEVYTITQGGTTTTITIDPAANSGMGSTVVSSGATTMTLNGVPENYLNNVNGQASTMLYVDGNINSLSGPGEGQGAIQDNAMINITANGNITATGDVLYKTEPVTYTQNQIIPGSNPPCCAGTPMDYLIPSVANMNQVLGIFTANGNFITQSNYADNNIQVDGSIATVSSQYSNGNGNCTGAGGGFLANGFINTFNNVGGQIQSCIYAADIDTENIWFDRRFTQRAGFMPPWFPATTITTGGASPTNVTPTISRTRWVNTTSL